MLLKFLDKKTVNIYFTVFKPAKEFTDHLGRRKIKGNMDVELAIDVLEQCRKTDHVVLFFGGRRFYVACCSGSAKRSQGHRDLDDEDNAANDRR